MSVSRRKKVAVIYPFIPHYRRAVFTALARESRGFDYVFFGDKKSADSSIRSESQGAGFEMRIAPTIESHGLLWQRRLWSVVFGREFDVLIFLGNAYYLSTWVYALLARMLGKRVYFWTHGWLKKEHLLKRLIRNSFYRIANGLLLYGNRAKKIGIDYGFEAKNLSVIFNSLDYDQQRRIRAEIEVGGVERTSLPYEIRECPLYVACIARLTPQCSFELAIDALFRLRNSHGLDIPLVLIGDGPSKELLAARAKEKQVTIFFLGAMYNERQIGPIIYQARAIVSPGKIGLTAMHSLAYGTPVITHGDLDQQMPEVEAVVDGVNGSLFLSGDIEDLARKIYYWCMTPRTQEERAACIAAIEGGYTPGQQLILIESALNQG